MGRFGVSFHDIYPAFGGPLLESGCQLFSSDSKAVLCRFSLKETRTLCIICGTFVTTPLSVFEGVTSE